MDDQSVGPDHLHRPARLVDAIAGDELRPTDIGEDRDRGRQAPQLAVQSRATSPLQRDALRADGKRDAECFCRLGEPAIDPPGPLRPSGHRGDQQRRPQRAPEKARRQVDLGKVDLRQRHMLEAQRIESRQRLPVRQRRRQHDVEMVALAPADVRLRPATAFGRRACRCSLRRHGLGLAPVGKTYPCSARNDMLQPS